MANSVCEVLITESAVELPPRTHDAVAGAIVDFWGAVRMLEDGRELAGIEYEAHATMAEHQIRKLGETALGCFGLTKVIVHHRVGFVPVGEPSIVVRVESPHRSAAFKASQWIMDELKRTVPIWKRPVFEKEKGESASGAKAGKEAQRGLHS
jgi:molybdopterin synthase catalytic subunit